MLFFFSISNKFIKKLSKKKRVSQKLFLVDDILRHPLFMRDRYDVAGGKACKTENLRRRESMH